MDKNLKQALIDHYNSQCMTPSQLKLIKSQVGYKNIKWIKPLTGGLIVVTIILFTFLFNQKPPTMQSIANEVSYNHQKNMPVEVLTNNYKELNEALDRLDFTSVPSIVLGKKFNLIGGRYCSVQGRIAAQLKLKNSIDGKEYTLYQFKNNGLVPSNSSPKLLVDDSVTIKIWSENDLGYALAIGK